MCVWVGGDTGVWVEGVVIHVCVGVEWVVIHVCVGGHNSNR